MKIAMDSNIIKLSKREIEVCNLLLTGNCTNKIAELLNIKLIPSALLLQDEVNMCL